MTLADAALRRVWRVLITDGPDKVQFWFIALVLGLASGFAAVLFREAISALQSWAYGTEQLHLLHSHAERLPWMVILGLPILGGLVVGVILDRFTPDGRVRSVADVIEGAALRNGRVETRAGLASALASMITLSTGGSTGREGPVVHLAAVISTQISRWIKADGITGRDLWGGAVAAAVSASFNAPIAGALFALEVVLRHFAVHAFAPIVIASVAGTVVSRVWFGNQAEFVGVTPGELQFYVELPAFLLLGILSGLIAVVLMMSIFWGEGIANQLPQRWRVPRALRPAIAGAFLGTLAIAFPHIIGAGYETTRNALLGELTLRDAVVFAVIKVVAVAITMAGRMGGGVFSPALMTGALSGLAFGYVATAIFPDMSGNYALYAFSGMGAVAAAVLGAPISTTLIVFELTGDWQIGLAVMVSISLSTALASRLVDRSFFLTQLERRNLHLAPGPQAYLMATCQVSQIVRDLSDGRAPLKAELDALIARGHFLRSDATLDVALPMFDRLDVPVLPVVSVSAKFPAELPVLSASDPSASAPFASDPSASDPSASVSDADFKDDNHNTPRPSAQAVLFHTDALKAYNRALSDAAAEEHS
jgi:CIC family chloride channel protein